MKKSFECNRILVENTANSREKLLIRKKELHNYDLHWHDCFEIELVLKGKAVQILNGKRYEMTPGTIYLLNPTDFHSVESEGAVIYNIMFSEDLLEEGVLQEILNIENNIVFQLDEKELKSVVFMISQMLYEFEHEKMNSNSIIRNLMECLFIIILRKCKFSNSIIDANKNMDIRKALLYLHNHFRENPSLAYVAGIVGLNKNYFSGLFHSITGKTYKEYLNGLKLEYAKKLLLTSDFSVTEICYGAGFNSLAAFLRAFKNKYGNSPTTMRKNNVKNKE